MGHMRLCGRLLLLVCVHECTGAHLRTKKKKNTGKYIYLSKCMCVHKCVCTHTVKEKKNNEES